MRKHAIIMDPAHTRLLFCLFEKQTHTVSRVNYCYFTENSSFDSVKERKFRVAKMRTSNLFHPTHAARDVFSTHTQRMTECIDGWHNEEPACECVFEAPYVINNVDSQFRRAENEQEVIRSQILCSPFLEVCKKLKECNSFIQQKHVDARRHDENNYREGLGITDWTQTRTLVAREGRGCTVCISLLILLIDGNCIRLSLSFRQTRHTNGPEKWWNRRSGPQISHWFMDAISSHALPVLQFISLNNCRQTFRFCAFF